MNREKFVVLFFSCAVIIVVGKYFNLGVNRSLETISISLMFMSKVLYLVKLLWNTSIGSFDDLSHCFRMLQTLHGHLPYSVECFDDQNYLWIQTIFYNWKKKSLKHFVYVFVLLNWALKFQFSRFSFLWFQYISLIK